MGPATAKPFATTLLLAASLFSFGGYDRNAGHLPRKKAEADARRLGDVIERFQRAKLGDKCVSLKAKHGLQSLWNLVNEEGRGLFPPRAGTEAALYLRLKQAIANGERLDPERVLELGLEANLRDGEVNLQQTFLCIHNVMRLLARPEAWWCDSHYARGLLIWTPTGEQELTRGRWEPGWRGMAADSMFPIVRDAVGEEALEGGGKPTLAAIRGETWRQKQPEKQREHEQDVAKAREQKRSGLDAARAELDRRTAERDQLKAEIEAARNALSAPGGPDSRVAAVRIDQMRQALESLDAALKEARATVRRLTEELAEDITTNVPDSSYTRHLFDVEGGAFQPLYGAEEATGNGGNWYYFWLGAVTYSAEGTVAEAFGARYEAGQKWLGTEDEYARGLVQLSHFAGGAELARQAWTRFRTCEKPTPAPAQLPAGSSHTAEKGAADAWSHLVVTVGNATEWKTEDQPGWRNNGTGFSAHAPRSGPVPVRIEVTGKAGVSYGDYNYKVSVQAPGAGGELLQQTGTLSKDGASRSFACTWDPARNPGGLRVHVQITGGNPEFFTYFVDGTIDAAPAKAR